MKRSLKNIVVVWGGYQRISQYVTQDDFAAPLQRLEVDKITGHQSVRGRGGIIAVLYKTLWMGLSESSWEREMGLQHSLIHILRYWAGAPDQCRQTNRLLPPNAHWCGIV